MISREDLAPLPRGRFSIVYADPPWQYRARSWRGENRSADHHYETQSLAWIRALPVCEVIRPHSAVFLWVTAPMLQEGIGTLRAWGFRYSTIAFVWIKTTKAGKIWSGQGYSTRQNAELCLLGRWGSGLKRKRRDVSQIVLSPRDIHSRKPAIVRDRIVDLYGDVPRVELFAVDPAPGWSAWGKPHRGALQPEQPGFGRWRGVETRSGRPLGPPAEEKLSTR